MRNAVIALALLFALPAEAGPIAWVKRQVTEHPVRTRIVASLISDAVLARGMYNAGIPNVENRQCHYGPAAGCYAIDVGLNAVMDLVGYRIGGKTGDAISYGSDAVELSYAGWQWNGGWNKPKEDSDAKANPDFSTTVIVRR